MDNFLSLTMKWIVKTTSTFWMKWKKAKSKHKMAPVSKKWTRNWHWIFAVLLEHKFRHFVPSGEASSAKKPSNSRGNSLLWDSGCITRHLNACLQTKYPVCCKTHVMTNKWLFLEMKYNRNSRTKTFSWSVPVHLVVNISKCSHWWELRVKANHRFSALTMIISRLRIWIVSSCSAKMM